MMTAHGPDAATFAKASSEDLQPVKLRPDGMAFMFESSHMLSLTKWAVDETMGGGKMVQKKYWACWAGLEKHFDGTKEGRFLGECIYGVRGKGNGRIREGDSCVFANRA
ncbi:hypothetical protein HK104_007154 [Borealophlyctis nickersoniae]|nr:hypothetical protein HK104_007154 [Borealophlyctis nickersoniae]